MSARPVSPPSFGPSLFEPGLESKDDWLGVGRFWHLFMTARAWLALLLLGLQGAIYVVGAARDPWPLVIGAGYLAAALAVRRLPEPPQLKTAGVLPWFSTAGADILAFAALQLAQGSNINYAPLLVLPVLISSVLGSMRWALGAAAGVTLLLFALATGLSVQTRTDMMAHFLQAALTGAGCFVIAILANLMAARLTAEERKARQSQSAAVVQRRVNELIIESMADGILVLDRQGRVWAANPAAQQLLGSALPLRACVFDLPTLADQTVLTSVIHRSYLQGSPQLTELSLRHANDGLHKIRVRAQLTATRGDDGESLCVVFLQDQRETEARIQTEKLASMGRMSAAVAHEIRNPLAAIAQANALLNEDLQEPRHRQLTAMIQQNSKRLEKIVDDVLNLSRAAPLGNTPSPRLELNAAVETACQDWARQTRSIRPPTLALHHEVLPVGFDDEHLRRILVNLLDNALRHVRHPHHGLQVSTTTDGRGRAYLSVWSDGAAMDANVERHLFEPFFSSQSRSSGLGLFICRALCDGHGAAISYRRTRRIIENEPTDGNDFIISFAS